MPSEAGEERTLTLDVLGHAFVIRQRGFDDPRLRRAYSSLRSGDAETAPARQLVVVSDATSDKLLSWETGGERHSRTVSGFTSLLARIDDVLVVEAQKLRPDLLFLHAAVVCERDSALVIVGESGAGKSTLCLGLVQRGLGYSSDELAPLRLPRRGEESEARESWSVHTFPRAITLKTMPPAPVSVPKDSIRAAGFHVATDSLDDVRATDAEAIPVGGIVILERDRDVEPRLRRLGRAEAVTALYPQTLNALAHAGDGLDPLLELCGAVPCWSVRAGELAATLDVLEQLGADLART